MTNVLDSLGQEFKKLNDEVGHLESTWKIFVQLFATTRSRVDLLNGLVPSFTAYVFHALVESVILGICRISDDANTGAHANLTLESLIGILPSPPDKQKRDSLSKQFQKIKAATAPLREFRNKVLGHLDLGIVQQQPGSKLPEVPRRAIDESLDEIRAYLNQINHWYLHLQVAYQHVKLSGDGENLLWWLRMGHRLSELQSTAEALSCDELLQQVMVPVGVDDDTA